jgi:hypothetical protein
MGEKTRFLAKRTDFQLEDDDDDATSRTAVSARGYNKRQTRKHIPENFTRA